MDFEAPSQLPHGTAGRAGVLSCPNNLRSRLQSRGLLEEDEKHHHLLVEAARDCGWCIFFQTGDRVLKELAEATVIEAFNPYRYELCHLIEHSFNGIGEWHTHGEA